MPTFFIIHLCLHPIQHYYRIPRKIYTKWLSSSDISYLFTCYVTLYLNHPNKVSFTAVVNGTLEGRRAASLTIRS